MTKTIKMTRPSDGKTADVAESEVENYARGGYLPDTGKAAEPAKPKTVGQMTVKELTAYASENDIELGEATKKAEILELIAAAEQAPADQSEDDSDEDEDDDFE